MYVFGTYNPSIYVTWSRGFFISYIFIISGTVALCAGCNVYPAWAAVIIGAASGPLYLSFNWMLLRCQVSFGITIDKIYNNPAGRHLIIVPSFQIRRKTKENLWLDYVPSHLIRFVGFLPEILIEVVLQPEMASIHNMIFRRNPTNYTHLNYMITPSQAYKKCPIFSNLKS